MKKVTAASDDYLVKIFTPHNNSIQHIYDWLVGWVLWHINHYRLFNAKSIFL